MAFVAFAVSGLSLMSCDATKQEEPCTPMRTASKFLRSAAPIPGRYIVVMKDAAPGKVSAAARTLMAKHGGEVDFVYENALQGFAAKLPEATAMRLAEDPAVQYVEEDSVVRATAIQSAPPSWGVDRVDQPGLPLDGSYTYDLTGAGVNVYIFDSGIRTTHTDFGGRAFEGFTAISDGHGHGDCAGHGTHVAATVAGASYGVAKDARVHSVRILDCENIGPLSGIIAGVNWMRQNHTKPAVANFSISGPPSRAMDDAIRSAIGAGITVVVAAGNEEKDACRFSPGRVAAALVVGGTTKRDDRAFGSNWGSCVDLFAPGLSIVSASHIDDTLSAIQSGTSMAAPHVTGAVALYLQNNRTASPAVVHAAILDRAAAGVVADPKGSPNRMLRIPDQTMRMPVEPCGNGFCGEGEDAASCPGDCVVATCGDGVCEAEDENSVNCPSDCGGCVSGQGSCGEDACAGQVR
ncbi:S8 family peptidase [Pyxidicoccus sp. 3LFB2]